MNKKHRQKIKLGEYASFKTGKLDSNAATTNGEYPFFTCSRETFLTDTYSFDTECVLLAGNNAAGKFPLKYFVGKFDAYQRTYIIEPLDAEKLNTRFLFYALQLQLEYMRSVSTGATTKFLTKTILDNLKLTIPPLPTQQKIAAVLSAYDDLIENNTRRIQILEEMAQTIYRQWFVEFEYPGHEDVPLVDSGTELGMIPEGWEVEAINDVAEVLGGGTPSTKKSEYWEDGNINWFAPRDLTKAGTMFIGDSPRKINELGLQKSSAKMFPAYSVMMTSRATLGVTAINTLPACTNQGFITCVPNERLSNYQIYFWIAENLEKITSVASGATFKEITKGTFRKFLIVIAPPKIHNHFVEILEPIGKQIENLQQKNANLRATRDLLLPRLVSGEVGVEGVAVS